MDFGHYGCCFTNSKGPAVSLHSARATLSPPMLQNTMLPHWWSSFAKRRREFLPWKQIWQNGSRSTWKRMWWDILLWMLLPLWLRRGKEWVGGPLGKKTRTGKPGMVIHPEISRSFVSFRTLPHSSFSQRYFLSFNYTRTGWLWGQRFKDLKRFAQWMFWNHSWVGLRSELEHCRWAWLSIWTRQPGRHAV